MIEREIEHEHIHAEAVGRHPCGTLRETVDEHMEPTCLRRRILPGRDDTWHLEMRRIGADMRITPACRRGEQVCRNVLGP